MINRRDFLAKSAAGLAWLGVGGAWQGFGTSAAAGGDPDDALITILHTNDVHSRIDPFPEGQSRSAGLGGAARRATLIEQIRRENPHTLLLDAGDAFQGTPYFNIFRGEVDFKVMSALGYEAMAVGNHEFDVGLDGLLEACRFANFELLSANYDFSRTVLRDLVKPYIVRRVGPVRVGIFGVSVMLKGLVAGSLCRDVGYSNPIPAARLATEHLRTVAKCDLVICLSHLGNNGYGGEPGEQDVAREVEGIDLVVGGHSHTFMDEPTRVQHVDRETLVFQVGWAGINLGRVDFHMRAGRVTKSLAQSIPVGTAAHAPALRG